MIAEFNVFILGDGYGSDNYGTRETTSKLLYNVHDLSVTLGPHELTHLQRECTTTGALLTEQEPWKNGEYIFNFSYIMTVVRQEVISYLYTFHIIFIYTSCTPV
jgi:hypothetical protein